MKKRKKKKKIAVLRLRKSMPCLTGTRVIPDKKKEARKKKCRGKQKE